MTKHPSAVQIGLRVLSTGKRKPEVSVCPVRLCEKVLEKEELSDYERDLIVMSIIGTFKAYGEAVGEEKYQKMMDHTEDEM